MANDVTKKSANAALAAAQALKGKLSKAKASIPDVGGSAFLRFLQDGMWVFGKENNEVDGKDEVALNPLSIETGFSCWTDRPGKQKNENLGEVMFPLGADAKLKHEMPEHRDPKNDGELCEWREQISIKAKFLTGKHKGTEVLYKTTSVGGVRSLRNMIDAIMLQLDEDPEYIVPVVFLSGDHYNHTSYGRTYTPVIDIQEWMSMEAQEEVAAAEEVEKPQVEDAEVVAETPPAEDETVGKTTRRRRR